MKHTFKLFALLFLCYAFSFSQSGQKNFIDQPFIEVTGTVETEIIPNEIFLKIVLNENDKRGKLSIEKQENQMILTLKTLNINVDKNLSVLDFNGSYHRKFLGDNEVVKNKHYQLIVNDGKTLGEVYEALDACDISNISITKTSHTELETFRRETKLKALKTAKEKANDYTAAIGQTIGKAIFIQEISSNNFNVLANQLNSINSNYTQEYQSFARKIENLNLKPIILKETVMAKFILN
ncbi:SIMPL domain-containing protein [Hyunsoonleella flava]|uniref:SIMPL domain-containing protein n=1 Tax=Hyunsoonleella flava TaxID=2527939 RepID=A0A4V2J9X3_9FLAO|nr:SIMPL domain-containing protein [Hyunsoonleella flava]TBN01855.1 SIMPL domain-containing protein [Hyunsoonleella flava]